MAITPNAAHRAFSRCFSVYDFTDKVSGKGIACRCGINGFYRENALCAAFGVIAIHGKTPEEALKTAAMASAIAVGKKGASTSIPTLAEVRDSL